MHPDSSPLKAKSGPHTEPEVTALEMGGAKGVFSDGRPWFATLWVDDEGDHTLSISYAATRDDADTEEGLMQWLVQEKVLHPVGEGIEFFLAEKQPGPLNQGPVWVIDGGASENGK